MAGIVITIPYTSSVDGAVLNSHSGTQPNPPDGQNVFNRPETLHGEVFLESSIIDPLRGYAYFGADSNHGQVVKVAIPQLLPVKVYLPLILR